MFVVSISFTFVITHMPFLSYRNTMVPIVPVDHLVGLVLVEMLVEDARLMKATLAGR